MSTPETTPLGPSDEAQSREASPKLCVYTSLMGGYETLNEQPMAHRSNMPFICLTDDPELQSDSWELRLVTPLFALDPARSQRDYKLRPHVHLPEFDGSMYIDNTVILTQPPEEVFDRHAPKSGLALGRHSFRDSVLDEFLEVLKLNFDDSSRIFEQLNHYALTCPEILEERPYWGGVLLRDHRDRDVCAMLDTWFANVLRYSRRDQLSLNAVLAQAHLRPDVMDIEMYSSWFHTWPHTPGRDRSKASVVPALSLGPPIALARQLQQQLAAAQKQHAESLASEAWLLGKWLTESAERHPRTMGLVVRMLKRFSKGRGAL